MTARIFLILRKPRGHRPRLQLELVFQSELHNPRIQRITNLSESIAVERRVDTTCRATTGARCAARPEAIQHIECFCADFKPLHFVDIEAPRQRYIEGPGTGADSSVVAEVAIRSWCR